MRDTDPATDIKTVRRVVAGVWICAGIVMVTSVADAFLAFGSYGGNRGIGLGLGVAVDLALCVGLVGDRWLAKHARRSEWGRPLRVVTFLISIILNTSSAIHEGHYFLALLLGCLPVVLWFLTEYGNDLWMQATEIQRAATPPAPALPTPAPVSTTPPPVVPTPHPVVITRPPEVPTSPVIPPAVRRVPPVSPTPPARKTRQSRATTEVTPELVALASKWAAERVRARKSTGRRSMTMPRAEGGLGLSEPMARKVLAELNKDSQHIEQSA